MEIKEIKIKFLRMVNAPQQVFRTRCACCGPELEEMIDRTFFKDEEIDPLELRNRVDLSGLTINVDYIITHLVLGAPTIY